MRRAQLHIFLAFVALPGLVACDETSTASTIDLPTIDFADGFQQSDADAIIRECNAENVALTVESPGEIIFEPRVNADYDASVCVLNYIKESGTTKFGFIGNEKYRAVDEGQ